MLPLILFALSCGPVQGLVVGCAFGLLQLIEDFYVIHPVQLLHHRSCHLCPVRFLSGNHGQRGGNIPDIFGKERRKAAPGKEGKLGVEGMDREVLLEALRRAGATFEDGAAQKMATITKQDMMELGLSGGKDSSSLRLQLLKKLNLPQHMSANAMLQALNLLYSLEELTNIVKTMENDNG